MNFSTQSLTTHSPPQKAYFPVSSKRFTFCVKTALKASQLRVRAASKNTKISQNGDFPAKSSNPRFPARFSTRSNPLGAFTYAYVRATNRLDTITFPNWQKTVFSYADNIGDQRLKEINNYVFGLISNRPVSDFQYTYHPVGTIASWQQQADSNPATQLNLSYDATDELIGAVQEDASASVLTSNQFQYDLAGNRLAETTLAGTTAGQFNGLNQLTSLNINPPVQTVAGHTTQPAQNVSVNAVPATITQSTNFVASVPLPNGTNVVTISAQDSSGAITTQRTQVVTSGSSTGTTSALFYDANGNTGVDENGNRYTWDALNRVTAINYARGGQSQFVYDGLSRRVAIIERDATGATTSTKLFLWIGQTLAEERDVQNNVTKRFFAQGEQQAGVNYFYTRDHLGSVRELVDANDNIVARYDYDPYGRTTLVQGTNLADFQYAGYYQHAPSGLNLTLYRAYDANTGRWLSRDPLKDAETSQGPNLYEYVENEPINAIDPFGLAIDSIDASLESAFARGDFEGARALVEALKDAGTISDDAAAQLTAKIAQAESQALANAAKKLSEDQLTKLLECPKSAIHGIKDVIKKQFADVLKKAGIKNPDLAVDSAGNLVLRAPGGTVSIPTGIPIRAFAP